MASHIIAIVSDYTSGVRIGWHYAEELKLNKKTILEFTNKVKEKCGDVQLALHKLSTDSTSWSSVVEKDAFFDDVVISHDAEEFISLISKDQKLTAYDVAKFILSVSPTSHLRLQKLLYYTYSRFLLKTGEKLFPDPIVAYKYGPVIESVFHKFRVHGSSQIDFKEDETMCLSTDERAITPSFMKVISSEHGTEAVDIILDVLQDFSNYSANDLVTLTHLDEGPWDRIYRPGRNSLIQDDIITRYHHVVDIN